MRKGGRQKQKITTEARRHGDTEKSEINEQQIQNLDHTGHRGPQRDFLGKIKGKRLEPWLNSNY